MGLLTVVGASATGVSTVAALVCIVLGIAVAVWGAAMRARTQAVSPGSRCNSHQGCKHRTKRRSFVAAAAPSLLPADERI